MLHFIDKCVLCTETTLSRRYIRNVYCTQKNSFQTLHQKCVQCTEAEHILDSASEMCMFTTEHYPDGTSEMYTVHRNRTLSRSLHQKCVLCTKSEHFPDGTHIPVFINHKITLKNVT